MTCDISLRLLLGNTVKGSAFLNEVKAVDRDDLTVGEKLADDTEGTLVIFGLTESRDNYGADSFISTTNLFFPRGW